MRHLAIVLGILFPSLLWGKNIPTLRVRVKKSLSQLVISGTDIHRKIHINNDQKKFAGRKSIKFNCENLAVTKPFSQRPILLASLNSATGLMTISDKKFKGVINVIVKNKEGCDVVQETNMEDYISSLLAKEMNSAWPLEALKAQAVAARTYALHKKRGQQISKEYGHEVFYDLENSEKHQVSGSFFDATMSTFKAALATRGHILKSKDGKITPAFFHAKCGGKTLRPDQVWTNKVSGYRSVSCPYCRLHGKKSWKKTMKYVEFRKFLKWLSKNDLIEERDIKFIINRVRIGPDKMFRRNMRIYFDDKVHLVKKSYLRRYFGRYKFPSNNFLVSYSRGILEFKGEGLGHGVGMCQLGALDLAKKGWNFKMILKHYFPNHRLVKVY